MTRTKLPNRRPAVTTTITHVNSTGNEEYHLISFGFSAEDKIQEAFCANRMVGSDIRAMVTDWCITMSIYLQEGGSIHKLAAALGENRAEGATKGRPSSVFGSIARALAEFEADLHKEEK